MATTTLLLNQPGATLRIADANASTVSSPIGNQTATQDIAFSFVIPTGTFSDVDAGDILIYTADKADGTALPAWLTFNATTRTNSCTPAPGDVGAISVKITAYDSAGASVSDPFNLTVTQTPTPVPTPVLNADESCICDKIVVGCPTGINDTQLTRPNSVGIVSNGSEGFDAISGSEAGVTIIGKGWFDIS